MMRLVKPSQKALPDFFTQRSSRLRLEDKAINGRIYRKFPCRPSSPGLVRFLDVCPLFSSASLEISRPLQFNCNLTTNVQKFTHSHLQRESESLQA